MHRRPTPSVCTLAHVVATVIVGCSGAVAWSQPAQQPPSPQQQGQQPPQRVAVAAPASQQPAPLTPEQQAALDQLLAAWETRNAAVRTWACTFHKWEYNAWSPADANGERLHFSESTGELKYAAPDKGLFRVKETKQWSPENRR
jgi:hypothetical protein